MLVAFFAIATPVLKAKGGTRTGKSGGKRSDRDEPIAGVLDWNGARGEESDQLIPNR